MDSDQPAPQRPTTNDRASWLAYWTAQGMPWRMEPEIDEERQRYLAERRAVKPDIQKGIYPFRNEAGGIKLTRADMEWLLATHDGGQGPVDWRAKSQRWRLGLDVRGANLAGVDLSRLPLARMRGGLARRPAPPSVLATSIFWPSGSPPPVPKNAVPFPYEWASATAEQRRAAAVILDGANLREAHFEGAVLTGASLHETNLYEASLRGANLCNALLRSASLSWADLAGADLRETHFELADLTTTLLDAADLRRAFFDGGTQLSPSFGSRTTGSARLADVQWGSVSLGEVHWVIPTGDEEEAWRKAAPDGASKSGRVGEFEEAVRTYRQIASALKAQGLNEDADRFAYRAQKLQRRVLRMRRHYLRALGSRMLDVISGYGFRPFRSLVTYVVTIGVFAFLYWCVTNDVSLTHGLFTQVVTWLGMTPPPQPTQHLQGYEAVVVSMTSFHGRGFFQPVQSPGDKVAMLAAIEAAVGLLIEITFIATFTQRFFAR